MPSRLPSPSARLAAKFLLLSALLGAGCSGPATRDAPPITTSDEVADGDRLIVPIDSDPPSLNFVSCTDTWCRLVSKFVADSLVDEGENMEPVPRLAASWDFSADRKVLTFHLRPGVRWHDGAPFDSRDVLFTYRKIVDPASGARADLYQDVTDVSAPDAMTVRVTYREPTLLALDAWKTPLVPEHRFSTGDFKTSPAHLSPVGTGPYRFISWERNRQIVLEANREYFGARPHLDGITLKIIPSQATQFQALLAGEVDWSTIPPEQWEEESRSAEFRRRFQIFEYPALFLYYIAWNERSPLFHDPRVRNAMTLSLDRAGFLAKAQSGAGLVAATMFHPRQLGFDPYLAPPPFDPPGAARLLDEAGWKRDPGSGRRRLQGRSFHFTLLAFSGSAIQERIASLLADSLGRLGVEAEIRLLDFPALLDRLHRRDFEAVISGWALGSDPDPTSFLHSDPALGTTNYAGYSNPEADRLLIQGRHEFDEGRRRDLYRKVQEIVARDQPYTFLFFPLNRIAVSSRFHGVKASATGSPMKAYPQFLHWYVPRELQRAGRDFR